MAPVKSLATLVLTLAVLGAVSWVALAGAPTRGIYAAASAPQLPPTP